MERVAVPRWLDAAFVAFALVVLGSWLFATVALARDAYGVDHVGGTWLGLARLAGEGTLYPAIYDGESFGGTRYMPLPILLHGALGALLGDYLVAGKLIVFASTLVLLALVLTVLRAQRCPTPVAVLLVATLLVSGAGVTTSIWIRHDVLPVVLQLAAVALVARSTARRALVAAGVLSALALAAKLSAIWAPLAIVVWLLVRERERIVVFAATFAASAIALLGTVEVATHGRLSENVLGLGLSTARGFESFSWELDRLRLIFGEGLGPLRLFVMLALALVVARAWRRQLSLYHVSLLVALLELALVLADRGTSWNQLLDLQVLSVVVVGSALGSMRPRVRGGLALAILLLATLSYAEKSIPPLEAALAAAGGDRSRRPPIALPLSPAMQVLSEDPYVPISLGHRPVVLDAYMLWSIMEERPGVRADLIARLDRQEFDAVVLFDRPADRSTLERVRYWYDTITFGRPVVDAIERNYRPSLTRDGRWILTPKPRGSS